MSPAPALVVRGPAVPRADEILTAEALGVRGRPAARFGARRDELLAAGAERRAEIARTATARTSCPRRRGPRGGDWQVAAGAGRPARPPGRDHRPDRAQDGDQRAQLRAPRSGWPTSRTPTPRTGPTSSAARSTCTTPSARTIAFTSPEGKHVRAASDGAAAPTIVVRPRGWHLDERHLPVDGQPRGRRAGRLRAALLPQRRRAARAAAAARTSTCPRWRATSRRGSGTTSSPSPRSALGIPHGTVRATVLIETIPAAFEMDEILYELRDARLRAERRPLGLPVQHHQVLPRRRRRLRAARTGRASR